MPDRSGPLRVVLVGAGRIAADHVRAIDAVPDVELAAVADPDLGAAAALARDRPVVVAPDLAAALASAPADAAIIATPTATHTRIGAEALDAGLHAMIEKPVAPSRQELRSLVARAEGVGRVLVSGQVVRFLPTVSAARTLLDSGAIGEVEQIVERRVEHRAAAAPWWSDTDDFLLHHWGSHSIDLVLDLLGVRVTRVLCRGGSGVPGFDGLDSINLLGDLSNGGRIALNQSFSSREPLHDLLVVGRAGTLLFSGYRSLALDGRSIYSADESAVLAEGFRAQLADFATAARGGASPRAAAHTVDGCLAVIEAASRSLRSGAVEAVG
ncbi:MAG: Gfo/Idh/MocA family oxidoreductase [Microbacteriaceae bacterium]|nr:Gfo/Idh/MocA family oxidoreductase [Microbacteriaceae bacterium]